MKYSSLCCFLLIAFALFLNFNNNVYAISFTDNEKIKNLFVKEKMNGTIVIYNVNNKTFTGYNSKRANIQYSPASTFKIANSLIGLASNTVKSVDEVFFKYENQPVFLDSWKKDSSLRDAIKVSNFLAYQHLATKIGKNHMEANIKKIEYGNMIIGNDVTNFWVDNSLRISAIEQVKFLAKLATCNLPYSKHIQLDVASIIKLEQGENWELYGKTGWYVPNNKLDTVGWFVGWVTKNNETYVFAMNIDVVKATANDFPINTLNKRAEITKEALKILGIIK